MGQMYTCQHQQCPHPLHRRSPRVKWAQKLGALLTVCVKVLPDLQELGRRQLGQVQVRGLLLRASHGERFGDLRQQELCLRTPHSARSCAPRGLYIQSGGCSGARPPAGGARAQRIDLGRRGAAAAQGLCPGSRWGGRKCELRALSAGLGKQRFLGANGKEAPLAFLTIWSGASTYYW